MPGISAFVVGGLFLGAFIGQPVAAKVHLSVSAGTDYAHRGLTQTTHGPSFQGLLEYEFDNGVFVGTWAGNVEFGEPGDRDYEVDYFLGYGHRLNSQFAFDVTVIRYTYGGQEYPRDYDWNELIGSTYLGDRWLVSAGVADNWLATEERTMFGELGYRYPLAYGINLDATVGYQALPRPYHDYPYGELGLSRSFGPFDLRVAYATTGTDSRDWFDALAKDRWTAIVSYTLR